MWFNNAIIYHYKTLELDSFFEVLQEHALKPCPPHARFIDGFTPVFEEELALEINGFLLFSLGKEERILPRAVISRLLKDKVKMIEEEEARSVKRAEKKKMAEDLEFELLPKSFCIEKVLTALIDTREKRLIIHSSSKNRIEDLTTLLAKSMPGMGLVAFSSEESLAHRFSNWIQHPHTLPAPFSLASDCQLFSPNDEKKRVVCRGYELPAEEIDMLLSQGLACSEISLIWHERIQFTLTLDLTLKRIRLLNYLENEWNETDDMDARGEQDAKLILLGGELRGLINDIQKLAEKVTTPKKEEACLID